LVCRNGPSIHSLLFADDLVLFTEASYEQSHVIKECLDIFCAALVQKISQSKCRIFFSRSTPFEVVKDICETLRMEATEDLGKHLGVFALHRWVTRAKFQYILDRMEQKLAGWKTQCLSLAGCATLIQSSISTTPSYVMQTTRLPRSFLRILTGKLVASSEEGLPMIVDCTLLSGMWLTT